MNIGNRCCLALVALVSISAAFAGPLKFKATDPEEWTTWQGNAQPADSSLTGSGESPTGVKQLKQGDRVIFDAKMIDGKSVSDPDPAKGIWAISAVTGDRPPMYGSGEGSGPDDSSRDDKGLYNASPREIWVVTPDGKSRRLSKPDMDATRPLISPDGRYVAFSGRQCDANNNPGGQAAYIVSVKTGEIVEVAHMETLHDSYEVGPTRWSADSRSVTIAENWGEVGGNGALRTVTLEPES